MQFILLAKFNIFLFWANRNKIFCHCTFNIKSAPLYKECHKSRYLPNLWHIGCKHSLFNHNLPIQRCKHFLLLLRSTFRIDVHGSLNIRMSHDRLDYLQIGFILAKPGTEGMSQMMTGEMKHSADIRTRTETPVTRLLVVFKTTALPIRLISA